MAFDKIKADTYRKFGVFSWGKLFTGALTSRTFRIIVLMRLSQYCAASRTPLRFMQYPFKILHRCAAHMGSMDFPSSTQVGAGLAITHGWGIVVSQGAKIGQNVTLLHGVTIGQRDEVSDGGSRRAHYPVIEDEVWIGPNAVIVGGVVIGQGSKIAAGAFVTASIPPYSVVVGNPGVIVKTGCIPDVMNKAPFLQKTEIEPSEVSHIR
ncbi:serine acetyltransferase [Citrobacter sp. Marseille-Q6884]|uniref:serine acetyltransferase n=1 Tax=Citrobacter sp. Marseille-Q6884 TaxID=2956786 RepID=UPI0021B23B50|nr:serine acetyltransferase [Citrobacter sp. Marseille-Q6884]